MAWKDEYRRNRYEFIAKINRKIEENVTIGSINILQNKAYKWEERLILLGLFLDRVEELTASKTKINLLNLIDVYSSDDFHIQAEIFFYAYRYDYKSNDKIMKEIFSWTDVIVVGDVSRTNEIIKQCNREYEILHNKVFLEWGYAIENYFVQEYLYDKYPFKLQKGLMHNYFTFLLLYKEFEYNLYKIFIENETISKEKLSKLMRYFTTCSDHSNNIINAIEKFSLRYEDNPLSFMQSLIWLN